MIELPNLRRLRESKGWSQRELARRASIGMSTVIRLERGEAAVDLTVKRLAEALGVEPAVLTQAPAEPAEETQTA